MLFFCFCRNKQLNCWFTSRVGTTRRRSSWGRRKPNIPLLFFHGDGWNNKHWNERFSRCYDSLLPTCWVWVTLINSNDSKQSRSQSSYWAMPSQLSWFRVPHTLMHERLFYEVLETIDYISIILSNNYVISLSFWFLVARLKVDSIVKLQFISSNRGMRNNGKQRLRIASVGCRWTIVCMDVKPFIQ